MKIHVVLLKSFHRLGFNFALFLETSMKFDISLTIITLTILFIQWCLKWTLTTMIAT